MNIHDLKQEAYMNITNCQFIKMHMNRDVLYEDKHWKERQSLCWTIRIPNQVDSALKRKQTEVWNKSIEKCECLNRMNNAVWL